MPVVLGVKLNRLHRRNIHSTGAYLSTAEGWWMAKSNGMFEEIPINIFCDILTIIPLPYLKIIISNFCTMAVNLIKASQTITKNQIPCVLIR